MWQKDGIIDRAEAGDPLELDEIMGLFEKDIQLVKDEQVTLVKCQKTIRALVAKLSKQVTAYIQNEWDKTFPGVGVYFLSGFEAGCMTDNWVADVYFYGIEDKEFYRGGLYDVYSDDLGRYEVRKVEPPVSITKIRSFLKRMSEETGAKCKMCSSSYVKRSLGIKIGLRNESE